MGRASKRQQREKDQLKELGFTNNDSLDDIQRDHQIEEEDEEEEEEEEDQVSDRQFSKSFNAFASLGDREDQLDEDDGPQDGHEEDASKMQSTLPKKSGSRKKSKPKKKAKNKSSNVVTNSTTNDHDGSTSPDSVKQFKNTKKDSRIDQKTPEVDEIEEALKELGLSHPNLDPTNSSSNKSINLDEIISSACSIDCKMLDADQELRRMFGSRVISSALNSTRSSPTPYHPRISNNPHHQVNLRLKTAYLAKPQPTWPPFDKMSVGFSMRPTSAEEGERINKTPCSQEVWFTFEHSARFKAIQAKFIQAIMSHDPNRLMALFQSAPYHPDTLLQLSDISAQQGDTGQALDFLNRALYSFERCFNPLFNISKGLVRLNFKMVENRGFFRAIDKSMQLLAKRGCWRTAFETCKLLFAMDPYQDPYGALLWLDFLAPKAKQYQYFLDLSEHLPEIAALEGWGFPKTGYPGFAYAAALCRWHHEEEQNNSHETSTKELETAIVRFPQLTSYLGGKLGISLPKTFSTVERASPRPGFIDEHHLIHLQAIIYVTRSSDLWKEPDVLSWFQTTVSSCHHRLSDDKDPDVTEGQKLSQEYLSESTIGIYRTVLLSGMIFFVIVEKYYSKIDTSHYFVDHQVLKGFLPPKFLAMQRYSFDPAPPIGGTAFNAEYFNIPDSSNNEPRQDDNHQDDARDEGGFQEIFDRIIEGVAAMEGGNRQQGHRQQLKDQIEQIQLILQTDEGNLTPEAREELLELLEELLIGLREGQDADDGGNVQDEEDVVEDGREPMDRNIAEEGEAESSDRRNTDRIAMPGSFQVDDSTSVNEETHETQPGIMDRLWRWVG
ncbi:uncharacterized protein MELLADRAFT_94566 [Melampsora larici-populina 98AG31]|uniref:Transcription factor 25 n=1 Tax=Melampsora larici-populina (strain 98AG31 / pathotype 3-4-7) TaxID=747676 RepID=F4RBW3_MELLP|nr:uncharacterized protein MELLADRAFT_94566 [Melampsora larici-populina 98AG31]EGG10271.1 hypothetical protein MELLADRAFT_94566 [Melampsora larici-populina 98AG31]